MKLFFDLFGFIFVVGLDQTVVEWCIDSQYKEKAIRESSEKDIYPINGSDYIKKIFQVPFNLLPVSVTQLDEFLNSIIKENKLSKIQREHILDFIKPHLIFLVDKNGLNPREIKRFLNAYTLNIKMKPLLDHNVILALKVVIFRKDWGVILEALYSYGNIFLDALERFTTKNEPNALINLDPKFKNIPNSFINYVSNGPGYHILKANPLEEYIRSCIAINSYGNSRILELVRDTSNLRQTLNTSLKKEDISSFLKDLKILNNGIDSIAINLKRSTNNVIIQKCYNDLCSKAQAFEQFDNTNSFNEWKEKLNIEISNLISALVDQYQLASI